MKKSSRESTDSDIRYPWLKACRESDFDGHSAFASLTPDQRLDWLSQAGELVRALKGRAHTPPPS